MASPFIIQQAVARHRDSTASSLSGEACAGAWRPPPPEDLSPHRRSQDHAARQRALERRIAKAESVSSSGSTLGSLSDLVDAQAGRLEGVLLKEKGGLHGVAGRLCHQPVFVERFFRLDQSLGTLEFWCSPEGADRTPAKKVLSLGHLLAVGQPGPRALTLLFARGDFTGSRRRLELRVPKEEDFHRWFLALARYARATGDV